VKLRLSILIATLLALLSLALPAVGQPTATSSAEEAVKRAARAKELNKQGLAMLDAGDLERALDYFLQSRQVLPTTKNVTNSAIVLEKLGRLDEALELYEELLLKYAGGLEDADREAIAPAMADLRPKVGSVEVSSNIGGVVQIDGRVRGKLPLLSPIRVMPGKHAIRVIQVGYREFETTVEVAAGESKSVDAKLDAIPGVGTLQVVETAGHTAEVFVDGTKLGTTPWEGALPSGSHLIWLKSGADRGSMPAWVEVIEGQAALSKLQVLPLGPPIALRVEPRTAAIEVDGLSLGTGAWSGQIPAGAHSIRASEAGYRTASRELDIKKGGGPVDLTITLEVDPTHPRWPRDDGSFVGELLGGVMVGPSLNGGADDGCPDACDSRSLALGLIVGARGGYRFPVGVSVEFGAGYMRLAQSIERTERDEFDAADANEEDGLRAVPVTYSLADDILVQGPYASAGVSFRHTVDIVHLGTRATAGVMVTISQAPITGTAKTNGAGAPVYVQDAQATAISAAPFIAPEINAGLALGPVDLGLSLAAAFFPVVGPELDRGQFGVNTAASNPGDPDAIENAPESSVTDGERAYGRFVLFVPMVTLGADF
jgi:hypothetical protein